MKVLTHEEIKELIEKAFDAGLNWLNDDPRSKEETIAAILQEIGEPE